jgi:hypothetical protein
MRAMTAITMPPNGMLCLRAPVAGTLNGAMPLVGPTFDDRRDFAAG